MTLAPDRPDVQTDTFDSLDPGSGEVVATFPKQGAAEVEAAVARAQAGGGLVARAGLGGPAHAARRLEGADRQPHADELAELVHRENGKPVSDALLEIGAGRRPHRVGRQERAEGARPAQGRRAG